MENRKIIGKGMTAEIFEWDHDKVLKLFYGWFSVSAVELEAKIGTILNDSGVQAPYLYDLTDIENRKGIIYERIHGKSMLDCISQNPLHAVRYARQMAWLHYQIHQQTNDQLPSQKERFKKAINDSKDILGNRLAAIQKELESLDNVCSICHGDFHPGNILIDHKRYVPIDWMNAYAGSPLGDVARTYLMLSSPFNPPGMPIIMIKLSGIVKKIINKAYIKEYIRLSNCKKDEIMKWLPLVAAARLRENIPGEEQWLLGLIQINVDLASTRQ